METLKGWGSRRPQVIIAELAEAHQAIKSALGHILGSEDKVKVFVVNGVVNYVLGYTEDFPDLYTSFDLKLCLTSQPNAFPFEINLSGHIGDTSNYRISVNNVQDAIQEIKIGFNLELDSLATDIDTMRNRISFKNMLRP